MGNSTLYYVWLLDAADGKAYRFKVDGVVAEDSEALEELLFDRMGFSAENCQWMVATDGKLYEEEERS